ncbi:MAG TPA: hypothetical protein VIS07_01115 [Candidatus Binatia bacterium]
MTVKTIFLGATLVAALLVGGPADAQNATPAPGPTLAPVPGGAKMGGPRGPMGSRMGAHGMRARGPMGGGPGGAMCTLAEHADTIEVKNLDDGVTITLRSRDKSDVTRMQKIAEAMRLLYEASSE